MEEIRRCCRRAFNPRNELEAAFAVRPNERGALAATRRDAGRRETVPIRIVRLGSPRTQREGVRIGTVRRPPRGVPKSEYAARDIYDVWLPNLAPSESLLKEARAASRDDRSWRSFALHYRAEMSRPEVSRIWDLLAALSHSSSFSIGCYCQDESRCHRSVMRELLEERGAVIV